MSYLVLDLETNTQEYLGRKGCYLVNDIVAIGLARNGKAVSYYKTNVEKVLAHYLPTAKILIGHNIKYDLLYIWKFEVFQEWLKNGGRILDTQLTEYMLSGQEHKYPALRDIAVNKYGRNEREKRMEQYWKDGVDTKDISEDLVREDVENDVLDTEAIMLQQVKMAKKEGMYTLVMEQMEGLLATTEIEYNGIYLNREIMDLNKKKLENELEILYTKVTELGESYWR